VIQLATFSASRRWSTRSYATGLHLALLELLGRVWVSTPFCGSTALSAPLLFLHTEGLNYYVRRISCPAPLKAMSGPEVSCPSPGLKLRIKLTGIIIDVVFERSKDTQSRNQCSIRQRLKAFMELDHEDTVVYGLLEGL
jgi:hypothetical protein